MIRMSKTKSKKRILEELAEAVITYDQEAARRAAQDAIDAGIAPMEATDEGFGLGISEVGDRFRRDEVYLPHLLMAAEAMKAGVEILQRGIPKEDVEKMNRGRVIVGTVEGDIHDLGKNIVAAMLAASGFEVIDLGKDVGADVFVSKAREVNADIIALSALMTTTMPYQREVIEELKYRGVRDKFIVVVGGGPVTTEWAEKIEADGFAENASEAVEAVKKLMTGKRSGGS
jgi:corrinoid protein of di/trimethylamine methyltransferase